MSSEQDVDWMQGILDEYGFIVDSIHYQYGLGVQVVVMLNRHDPDLMITLYRPMPYSIPDTWLFASHLLSDRRVLQTGIGVDRLLEFVASECKSLLKRPESVSEVGM